MIVIIAIIVIVVYFVRLRLKKNKYNNDPESISNRASSSTVASITNPMFGDRVSSVISGIKTKYSTFTSEFTKGANSKKAKLEDLNFKNPMFDETVSFSSFLNSFTQFSYFKVNDDNL